MYWRCVCVLLNKKHNSCTPFICLFLLSHKKDTLTLLFIFYLCLLWIIPSMLTSLSILDIIWFIVVCVFFFLPGWWLNIITLICPYYLYNYFYSYNIFYLYNIFYSYNIFLFVLYIFIFNIYRRPLWFSVRASSASGSVSSPLPIAVTLLGIRCVWSFCACAVLGAYVCVCKRVLVCVCVFKRHSMLVSITNTFFSLALY